MRKWLLAVAVIVAVVVAWVVRLYWLAG